MTREPVPAPPAAVKPMRGFYLHVPFCRSKCRYCDFYSLAGRSADAERMDRFLEGLACEWRSLPPGRGYRSVYLGGGTPTRLGAARLRRLLEMIRAAAAPDEDVEWTCEANPDSVTPEIAAVLREGGVNRVSLGVQAFDDRVLRRLGRAHDAGQAHAACAVLRAAGFENLGLDLLYGVPGLSRAAFQRGLEAALAHGPQHVSCYLLTREPGTPLAQMVSHGAPGWPGDGACAGQYALLRDTLSAAGYAPYEISNFARPGYACRHNMLYWTGGEYLGCGPSAHSHRDGVREALAADWERWWTAARTGRRAVVYRERLEGEARARETLIMGLRLQSGIERAAFLAQTGYDALDLCAVAPRLIEEGLLLHENGRLRLAERALFISDSIFRELV